MGSRNPSVGLVDFMTSFGIAHQAVRANSVSICFSPAGDSTPGGGIGPRREVGEHFFQHCPPVGTCRGSGGIFIDAEHQVSAGNG